MKKTFPFLLLILATFGVYAPSLRNGFVWDDTALILRDPLIRSWRLIPEGFEHFIFTDATASDFYRPIQRLTFTLEYAVAAFRPALYHFDSVLCHVGAAIALFIFARQLLRILGADEGRSEIVSLIAALIWTIHPVHTSAVAYVSGRADPLAAMFGFAGLACALHGSRAAKVRQWILLGVCALLFLLSALSKEAGLIFLAIWIALAIAQKNRRAIYLSAMASLSVLVIYASLRLPAEHIPAPTPTPMPLLVRPILFSRAIAEYAGLIVFPLHLQMDRDVATHPFGFANAGPKMAAWRELQTLAGIILLAGFLYWLLRERTRDRAVFLCLLLTALTYLPISGAFPLNANVAEHWLYLPSAFLLLAGVLVLWRLRSRVTLSLVRPAAFSILALWMTFLGGRTFVRGQDWRDQRTFLERTIAQGGDSARMLINLGAFELKEDRLEEAKKLLRAALIREPEQPLAVVNLAAVAVKQSDFKTAHELLAGAAQMPLVEAQAYELMVVLEHKESGKANSLRMRLASRTGPPYWPIEKRYIKLLNELGQTDAAIGELKDCLRTQWYRAETWQLLSHLQRKSGHAAEAAEAFAMAQRYDVHLDVAKAMASP